MIRARPRAFAVILALLAVFSTGVVAAGPESFEGLDIGDRPPAFRAQDLHGQAQSLEAHQGRVIVLHFWATWCPYCRAEVPKLVTIHNTWSEQGVVVLAVSVDEHLDALREFVAKAALPYTVIPETSADWPISARYRVQGLPTTYLIGADGRIVEWFNGAADLVEAVRQLIPPPIAADAGRATP
jgi:peroxiredoxin